MKISLAVFSILAGLAHGAPQQLYYYVRPTPVLYYPANQCTGILGCLGQAINDVNQGIVTGAQGIIQGGAAAGQGIASGVAAGTGQAHRWSSFRSRTSCWWSCFGYRTSPWRSSIRNRSGCRWSCIRNWSSCWWCGLWNRSSHWWNSLWWKFKQPEEGLCENWAIQLLLLLYQGKLVTSSDVMQIP